MEEDDDVLRLESFPPLRRMLWGSIFRTTARYIGIGLVGGAAMTWLAYYILDTTRVDLPIVAGTLMLLSTIPLVVHWTRHFLALLKQVDDLEGRVKSGEVVRASEVRFRSHRDQHP